MSGITDSELVGCWVSPGWSDGLGVPTGRDWPDVARPEEGTSGLVTALVARTAPDDQVSVAGFLVDVYCLGVKDALGPRLMPATGTEAFVQEYFAAYDAPPLSAPLDLVRQVVFGAVDYARTLGFEPHPDFAAAAAALGEWHGAGELTFGRNGRPWFIEGSADDAEEIMRTLDATIGRDGYDYLVLT